MNKNIMYLITILVVALLAYFGIKALKTNASGGGVNTGGGSGTGGNSPKVTIKTKTITTGSSLEFTITGFTAKEQVTITVVQTGGYFIATLKDDGTGIYSFPVSEGAGNYTLQVSGTSGTATDSYTIK